MSPPIQRLAAYAGVLCSRRAARRANGVIAVSAGLKKALPPDVESKRIKIIPCGIDLERFRPLDQGQCQRQLGWDRRTFHILFSTRGDAVKRPDLTADSVRALWNLGVPAEMHEMRGIPHD